MLRRLLVLLFVCPAALIAGCNTVEGFAQDLKAAGDALKRAVDRNRN